MNWGGVAISRATFITSTTKWWTLSCGARLLKASIRNCSLSWRRSRFTLVGLMAYSLMSIRSVRSVKLSNGHVKIYTANVGLLVLLSLDLLVITVVSWGESSCIGVLWLTLLLGVYIRDVLGKVAFWLQKVKSVGDIVSSFDPVHAALPWAGIRFLLVVLVIKRFLALRSKANCWKDSSQWRNKVWSYNGICWDCSRRHQQVRHNGGAVLPAMHYRRWKRCPKDDYRHVYCCVGFPVQG